ncbi:hypothetical protein [uncultured Arcticibacterium sp.]|uniref:hypothetical protein n=1 Tax=uncultured Arcticibacterium sp. TaxID=2173042 RepID=UPI0030F98C19
MDLDLGTIIVGIICTAICVVPFLLMGKSRKKKDQQKLQSLTSTANTHEGRITSYEFCGNFAIAIDNKKGLVFFHKEINGETVLEAGIDLNHIQECRLQSTSISVTKNKENYKMIERLELCFTPLSKGEKEMKWELFSRENNRQLSGELQAGEKWSKLINQQIHVKVW